MPQTPPEDEAQDCVSGLQRWRRNDLGAWVAGVPRSFEGRERLPDLREAFPEP
jgi:hypothetical protein